MTTTQLFVELLVIGFGVLIWLGVGVAAILEYNFESFILNINIATLTPLLAFSYVMGIIIDRLTYSLFRCIDKRNCNKVFGNESSPSPADKERYVLLNGDQFGAQITYNRSRLRISRSWSVNFLFISIALLSWQLRVGYIALYQLIFLIGILLMMALLCLYVATMLTKDHYLNVQNSYRFLIEHTNKKEGG